MRRFSKSAMLASLAMLSTVSVNAQTAVNDLPDGESIIGQGVPLKITHGLNCDVIAERKAETKDDYDTETTGSWLVTKYISKLAKRVDDDSYGFGAGCNAFYANGVQKDGAIDYDWEKGGFLRNPLDHMSYYLAPATGDNVVFLGDGENENVPHEGIVTLNLARQDSQSDMPTASAVYLLATATKSAAVIKVEALDANGKVLGTEDDVTVGDWYSKENNNSLPLVAKVYRIKVEAERLTETKDNPGLNTIDYGHSGGGDFYLQRVAVSTNTDEPIHSIRITRKSGGNLLVFAVTAVTEEVKLNEEQQNLDYLVNTTTRQCIAQTVKSKVHLKRTFKEGWNPLILPFDMTWAQVKKMFGEGVKLSKATDKSYKGNRVIFYPVDDNAEKAIEGGGYYLIKGVTLHTEDNLYSCERLRYKNPAGYPENKIGFAAPFTAVNDKNSGYTAVFKGVYVAEKPIDKSSYAMSGGKFYYYEDRPVMKGFRFWFTVRDAQGNAKKIEWAVEDDGVTAIENMDVDAAPADNRVYAIDGRLVSDKGLNGLAKGLYIMNNKKVMVK